MTYPVLILIFAVLVQSEPCPDMCLCKNYPSENPSTNESYYTSVTCDPQLSIKELSVNTRDLSISRLKNDENFQEIIETLLKLNLPYLINLKFSNSLITNLSTIHFIGSNQIRSQELMFDLTKLRSMDLSNNTIRIIENQPFRTMRMLEVLNLSANFLHVIDSESFSGLIGLKCLDLSENNLTTLNDKVLLPLANSLQYLNLSGNRLETINENCFNNLLKLQQLDLSWNHLIYIAPGSLELPSLIRLLLSGNEKLGNMQEPALLVSTGRRLQTVEISGTGLEQVPSALTHSIRTLRLGNNSIHIVRSGDFDSYPLLQLLDFVSNQLKLIEDDALGRLDSLSILYLTNNNLRAIPKSLPEKLKVLHLKSNQIERIKSGDFHGLITLEVLLLNDNKIQVLEEGVFSDLISLSTLDLSRNPISVLKAGDLSGPQALQVLRLSNIQVISPAKDVSFPLATTEHLVSIDLSFSPGLAKQFLTDSAVLVSSKELQELDISYTNTIFIRSDLLHFLPQLRILRIEGNYINCTELEWLGHWMRIQDNEKYTKIICNSPSELWGTYLIDLQDNSNNYQTTTGKSTEINTTIQQKIPIDYENSTEVTIRENSEISTENIQELLISNQTQTNETIKKTPSYNYSNNYKENATTGDPPSNLPIKSTEKTYLQLSNEINSETEWKAMFRTSSSTNETKFNNFLQPGSILLIILGLLAVSVVSLTMLALRFIRKRRNLRQLQQNDLEANTLPSISELW